MSLSEKHPDWEKVISTSPTALAETLGNLKYDQLADFLNLLSAKIATDAEKDRLRGRTQLALSLYRAVSHIQQSASAIDKAWHICKPHMPRGNKPTPSA